MWEQIRSNQRRSFLLVALMATVLFTAGYFIAEAFVPRAGLVGLLIAGGLWLCLLLVSYYQGDNIFLSIAGARKIDHDDLPVLHNVVEEMTIASGLAKMPQVYIIDDPTPNAFATGRTPDRAAVAVTSGLLQMCNRDELQGVVAHEMGHIKNRDTLLMLMAGVMAGAIVILSDIGLRGMWLTGGGRSRSRRSSGGGGQAQVIIMLVALAMMILAPIVAYLIYFAISRRREYLADASSARFTRYPEGLASALEKMGSSPRKLARATRATAPLYIVNPLEAHGARQASSLMSTHPPIPDRVRVLRSMGGASFAQYQEAFSGVHGRSVMPASSLKGDEAVAKREASREEGARQRARQVGDFFYKLTRYLFLACSCGTVLKLPPDFKGTQIKCPHCGLDHAVAEFTSQAPARSTEEK